LPTEGKLLSTKYEGPFLRINRVHRSYLPQDYGGISASRLEVLEERLKDDVLAELRTYGGRILLHTEAPDGQVIPIWEEARESDIATLKEVFASKQTIQGVEVHYSRVPITSERPPDFHE
jgi:hypothetical protein